MRTFGSFSDLIQPNTRISTSDNGPWVAEQVCSGSRGPFVSEWFSKHVDKGCTACPHAFVPQPNEKRPRRCVLPGTDFEIDGVHCGKDTGLGSVWESNLRMPALARYPPKILPQSKSYELISTLDVVPSFLSLIGESLPTNLDGIDMSATFEGKSDNSNEERILYFWRDGFKDGPYPKPYGRYDVAAVKYGNIKAWFWTKSAHYNEDIEEYHDPPLLFHVQLLISKRSR